MLLKFTPDPRPWPSVTHHSWCHQASCTRVLIVDPQKTRWWEQWCEFWRRAGPLDTPRSTGLWFSVILPLWAMHLHFRDSSFKAHSKAKTLPEIGTKLFFLRFVDVIFIVQLLSRVWLFATPWSAARQASLSFTNSQSPPQPMSIESVTPSNHLILCRPLLLLPSISPSIRVLSKESALRIRWPKDWSFSLILPMNTQDWFPLRWTGCSSRDSQGSSPAPQFKSINS